MIPERCESVKMGEYNWLRCCRQAGHEGEHNYCVDHERERVAPLCPAPKRKPKEADKP